MRKILALTLGAVLTAGTCLPAGVMAAEPAEAEDPALQLLEDVSGTYDELFTVICDEQYDQIWLDACMPFSGEDQAEMFAGMLKSACTGTLYGEEAIAAYGEGEAQFDCYFIEGVHQFVFDGTTISGVDEEGNEVFRHEYEPAGELSIGGMLDGFLYETADEDAGAFTYFLMLPDTPATTQHIEFRYGENVEDLEKYNEGPLAYWLAAGILADCDEQMIEDVITLFCTENLSEMGEEEAVEAESESEGMTEAAEDEEVIEIATAEDLAAINENLSGNYVLTGDIDLEGQEWTPIGSFVPMGESGEEAETPSSDYAFTGTFDGNGYTISNLSINQPENIVLGLFGCIANAEVGNFNVENADVTGAMMASAAVGYANSSNVYDVAVSNVVIHAVPTDMSNEGMFGGIVAAGMDSVISGCSAQAEIELPDNDANAGLVGGGLEMTSVLNCYATGTITAGSDCYGLGGISGCGFGAEEFTNCVAENVVITAGANTRWVGGVTGYAGGFEDESAGVPVTVFTDCSAENVTTELGDGSEEAGEIVGAGFYSEEVAQMMGAPFDAPTVYVIN